MSGDGRPPGWPAGSAEPPRGWPGGRAEPPRGWPADPAEAARGWPAGTATGIGSMPGTDPAEAVAVVFGELPDFPHLPELPARGPGADMIGRTACLLVEMPVETTPRGWKLADRPGRDQRRAAGFLDEDLDALEEAADGFSGTVKIQLCGPWTLAASLELRRRSELILSDPGAVADLIASLAEGAAAHAAGVRRRVPKARLVVQLDEPALPGVLAGAVPTASGFRRLPAIEPGPVESGLRTILSAVGGPVVVHCCAPDVPFPLIGRSGAVAAAFDVALLRPADTDALAEAAQDGLGLFAGAIAAGPAAGSPGVLSRAGGGQGADAARPQRDDGQALEGAGVAGGPAHRAARSVIELCRRIGLPDGTITEQVVVTPACGLAGATPAAAVEALANCAAAARLIPELIAEGVR